MQKIIQATNGLQEYKHTNGELSQVRIEIAGLGTKRIRTANLSPEIPESLIRSALTQFGSIKSIQDEPWFKYIDIQYPMA